MYVYKWEFVSKKIMIKLRIGGELSDWKYVHPSGTD